MDWMRGLSPIALKALLCGIALISGPVSAETPQEWIQLGTRIHGFFGGFIPVGIRIGLDAQQRLGAEPRGLSVTYYQGTKAPCPCIADGIMLATQSSPGQGTLNVAAEKAPPNALAVILAMSAENLYSVEPDPRQ
jgi:hypothetical protein